jgi:acetyl esterase/lipase
MTDPEMSRTANPEPLVIDGPHGGIDARLYPTANAPHAALVWVHGGAFAFGDLDMPESDWVARSLAARGIAVLALDYRKALDGVHHPVPGDDVVAGWRWAAANAERLGVSTRPHLGGASAGACLSAAAAKRLRDAHEPLPQSLVLVYPLLHAVLPEPSDELRATLAAAPTEAIDFDRETTLLIARNYAGNDDAFDDPYAFPANGAHAGLPPVLIVNSEYDRLRASGEAFGAALAEAGVEVRMETEPGTAHGHINEPTLPAATRTLQRIAEWILTLEARGLDR